MPCQVAAEAQLIGAEGLKLPDDESELGEDEAEQCLRLLYPVFNRANWEVKIKSVRVDD